MIDDNRRLLLLCLGGSLAIGCTMPAQTQARVRHSRQAVQDLIVREALRQEVPIALALAVAHAESNFDPGALSNKGARGVMQIMPATAWQEYAIEPDLLWQPRINVRIGLHFLNRLLRRYRGRVDLALSYYNGGSAVGDLPDARVLPATRSYVAKVLRLRDFYRYHRGEAYVAGA